MNENKKVKEIEDYEYLIGNVYFDPDKELQSRCVVTRISQKGRNIIAFLKRIIEGEVEENEFDKKGIHVVNVEKMLGIYLSEDAVDELNAFIESSTKVIDAKNKNKSNNTWSNDVDEEENSTRFGDASTRSIVAENKNENNTLLDGVKKSYKESKPTLYLANAGLKKLQTSVEDVQESGRITACDYGMEFTMELDKNKKGNIFSGDSQKVISEHPEDGEVGPKGSINSSDCGDAYFKKPWKAGQKRFIDNSLSRDVNMASEQAQYFLKVLELN